MEFMTTRTEALSSINEFINEVRLNKGLGSMVVTKDTSLLDGEAGIDSLDLAALVVHLEGETGCDPFRDGFINFNTAGELAALFTKN